MSSKVRLEMKCSDSERDGSKILESVWHVMLWSSIHLPVHTVCQCALMYCTMSKCLRSSCGGLDLPSEARDRYVCSWLSMK